MNVKESTIRERLVQRGKKLVKELNGLELSKLEKGPTLHRLKAVDSTCD